MVTPASQPSDSLRVLSIIPPMTQLNTPYPSTAYLTGFLRSRGLYAVQEDLALELVLQVFSVEGLQALHDTVLSLPVETHTEPMRSFVEQFQRYLASIGPTISFLQGHDLSLIHI